MSSCVGVACANGVQATTGDVDADGAALIASDLEIVRVKIIPGYAGLLSPPPRSAKSANGEPRMGV